MKNTKSDKDKALKLYPKLMLYLSEESSKRSDYNEKERKAFLRGIRFGRDTTKIRKRLKKNKK